MRKEKMVTRTFETTQFIIVGIKDNEIVRIMSDEVIGKMDYEACKKYAEIARPDIMVAGVEGITYDTALYGMPESTFLRNAEKLPPRAGNKEEQEQ